jgi:hypothetical protein
MIDPAAADTTIDHLRRSLSVPRPLMPALLAFYAGDTTHDATATARLQKSGLLHRDRLDPLVLVLLGVMTNPTLVMTIDIATPPTHRLATIWATPRRAVIGMTHAGRRFELLQVEPGLLPFHLAQATRLEPLPNPPFTGSFSLPAATLDTVEAVIITDLGKAEQELLRAGVLATWADRLLIALSHRRSLWTVESVWLGGRPRTESSLCVLDAGPGGYWELSTEPAGKDVTVSVSSFDELLARFAALLPRSIQI